MSKMSKAVGKMHEENVLRRDEVVENFMSGDSYVVNPLLTLKMVSASSIFGEASYYRKDVKDGKFSWEREFSDSFMKEVFSKYDGKTTTEIFTDTIDKSLDYDFKATLDFAVELRKDFNMRLNPQIIMVRAAIHPKRIDFTKEYPGEFDRINQLVMSRADEPMSQLSYFMYINNGKKNKLPTILKKSIAKKLSSLSNYEINKYKNHEIGMINATRITHANSKGLDELMTTGSISVEESDKTWEQMKSSGDNWETILSKITLPHMALLRNLRGIFTEINDIELCKKLMEQLKGGVLKGKQFPYRYYQAYKIIKSSDVNHQALILDTLEECIDIAIDNMPKLKGKTICLSDNSGSAWGAIHSEYGSVTIAEIDNLSSVLTAKCSDDGYVGKFGDKLVVSSISKRNGALIQADNITKNRGDDVGYGTEGGIWKFFKKAIDKKEVYDNIFIYSDQQAGHGGLYGTNEDKIEYYNRGYNINGTYINVYKLILDYRKKVNPKVNVISVQTAGYDNVLVPEMSYRTAILYGWTGRESEFAKRYIDLWDSMENNKKHNS